MKNLKLHFFLTIMFMSGIHSCKPVESGKYNIPERPNIIYILADDLGYGDMGCLGQEKFKTPNLDRMAAQGMMFIQHYSGSTVCAPSRAVLFTGLHTGHSPIRGNKGMNDGGYPISDTIPMLSEMFKKQGYITGGFGKWGMGYPGSEGAPDKRGFDEWFGYNSQMLAHNYYPEYLWHNGKKVLMDENREGGVGQYSFELIHEQAMKFIEENKDTSFFLYLPYTIPHAELIVPEDSIFKSYIGKFPETAYKGVDDGPQFRKGPYGSQKYPHAAFATMVTYFDLAVGDILNMLEAYGIAENTLVIFSSDNGCHLEGGADPDFFNSNGPFRGYKRDLYEGGIHVPMVAWWPGIVEGNSSSDHISAFWDIYPTFADLAGAKAPANIDGISMLPTMLGKGEQKVHPWLYWEFHEMGGRVALREGDWKLIRNNVFKEPDSLPELYNLVSDPGEETDLASEFPEIVERMNIIMKNARTAHPVWNF